MLMQFLIHSVHYPASSSTDPAVLYVAQWTNAGYPGNRIDQLLCAHLFLHPPTGVLALVRSILVIILLSNPDFMFNEKNTLLFLLVYRCNGYDLISVEIPWRISHVYRPLCGTLSQECWSIISLHELYSSVRFFFTLVECGNSVPGWISIFVQR